MKNNSSDLTKPGTEFNLAHLGRNQSLYCVTIKRRDRVFPLHAGGRGFDPQPEKSLFIWISSPFLLHLVAQYGSVLGLRAAVVRARAASSRETVACIPARFQADLGTNLIKQGGNFTGRPFGFVALTSEYSHGVYRPRSGHVLFPHPPLTQYMVLLNFAHTCSKNY